MAQYSVGDAIKKMLNESSWKQRYFQSRIKEDWSIIMGATVAKYTEDIKLVEKKLIIKTNVAPLKSELQHNKISIIEKINERLGEKVINEVMIF